MLTIGKADKYYTLWEITGPERVQYDTFSAIVTRHTYLQNLSFDFDKAKSKVEACTDEYGIDLELRGAQSFNKEITREYNPGVLLFGRHVGTKFEDIEDSGYLMWYYRNTVNTDKFCETLIDELVKRGELFEYDGEYVTEAQLIIKVKEIFTKEIYQLGHWETDGDRITKELRARGLWGYESSFGWVDVIELVDYNDNLYYVRGSYRTDEEIKENDIIVITGTIAHKSWYDSRLGMERNETQLKRVKITDVFS